MENKTIYLVASGKNQITFPTIETLVQYFQESGNLFDDIIDGVKFYEVNIKQIDSPLN